LNSGIQGSGLGLTLSQQIARAHNGDVTYQRRSGGGSIFTLRLPLAGNDANTADIDRDKAGKEPHGASSQPADSVVSSVAQNSREKAERAGVVL
jgi:hypothetical protein